MEKYQKRNMEKDYFLKDKLLYIGLLIVFLCDLVFIYLNKTSERFFTKPLIVPLLIAIYFFEKKATSSSNKLFLLGLIFSFLGDFFLLFSWGFLPGLGSFLVAHLCYIFCFLKFTKTRINYKYLIFISLYYFGLIIFLFPYLNEMKIPVIIYGLVISAMLYFSLLTKERFLIIGALLFVISDTLLSVNLFVKETVSLSLLVMITYVFAQFLLLKGILRRSITTMKL